MEQIIRSVGYYSCHCAIYPDLHHVTQFVTSPHNQSNRERIQTPPVHGNNVQDNSTIRRHLSPQNYAFNIFKICAFIPNLRISNAHTTCTTIAINPVFRDYKSARFKSLAAQNRVILAQNPLCFSLLIRHFKNCVLPFSSSLRIRSIRVLRHHPSLRKYILSSKLCCRVST